MFFQKNVKVVFSKLNVDILAQKLWDSGTCNASAAYKSGLYVRSPRD